MPHGEGMISSKDARRTMPSGQGVGKSSAKNAPDLTGQRAFREKLREVRAMDIKRQEECVVTTVSTRCGDSIKRFRASLADSETHATQSTF